MPGIFVRDLPAQVLDPHAERAATALAESPGAGEVEPLAENFVHDPALESTGRAVGPAHLGADDRAGGRQFAPRRALDLRLNGRADEQTARRPDLEEVTLE